jgi:hypothetical protein
MISPQKEEDMGFFILLYFVLQYWGKPRALSILGKYFNMELHPSTHFLK